MLIIGMDITSRLPNRFVPAICTLSPLPGGRSPPHALIYFLMTVSAVLLCTDGVMGLTLPGRDVSPGATAPPEGLEAPTPPLTTGCSIVS